MKAKEVMKLLNICRATLYNYTKNNDPKGLNKFNPENITLWSSKEPVDNT